MRKSFQAFGLGALVAMSSGVQADDILSVQPESRAYFNFNFGGARETKNEYHYGFQLQQRGVYSRDGEMLRPSSSVGVDYSNVGNNLMFNGKALRAKSFRLNQAEGEAAAAVAAEEPGFFGKVGNFFSDLWPFGGEEAAPAAEGEAAAAEPGWFDSYTLADYALLGVGVIGVGYAITEVADSEDSPDPAGGGNAPPPDDECDLVGTILDPDCPLPFFTGSNSAASSSVNAGYQEWLDSGTGQMGDLLVH